MSKLLRTTMFRKLLSSLFVFLSIHVYLVFVFLLFGESQGIHDYVFGFFWIGIPSIFIYAPVWSLLSDHLASLVTKETKISVRHRSYSLSFHLLGGIVVLFFISRVFTIFSIIAAFLFWVFDSYLLETIKRRNQHKQ
ncbi:hypothetical protein J0K78_12245 [Halobacillus sp. GSS1]|uniref:hypothetical protein n=1 Tax=Halobacillus sp. GSS1 TaxID=2815919 RepID=UPI001A8D3D4E|nr:hypothetical protein [Halobacillus sp. GSS1]MBN9655041.1 hypothetical protein [Halobacillus sp. GSS1]